MFVLLLYVAIICIFLTVLISCISVKNKFFRYTLCTLSGLLIVILLAGFVVDLYTYMNGVDHQSCEYIKLSEAETLGYFTVNDTYWGVGGHLTEHKLITKQNEKDMEIKVIEVEPDLENRMCVICHLPVSKFITFIKVPNINNNGYYDVYKYSFRAYETRLMKYITVLCILLFVYKHKKKKDIQQMPFYGGDAEI